MSNPKQSNSEILTCVNELEKWLQLLFMRWYRSPLNWLPISSMIRRTSSSLKSVQPIWILCLLVFWIVLKWNNCKCYFNWIEVEERKIVPKTKLFAQLVMITWRNFEYARKWKWMATVSEFTSINFNTRMINANSQICCIVIYPILQTKSQQQRKVSF